MDPGSRSEGMGRLKQGREKADKGYATQLETTVGKPAHLGHLQNHIECASELSHIRTRSLGHLPTDFHL